MIQGELFDTKLNAQYLNDILPLATELDLALSGGSFSVKGPFSMALDGPDVPVSGPLSVALHSVGGTYHESGFSNLTGQMVLSSVTPWAIAKPSPFSLKLVNDAGELANGSFSLKGSQKSGLTISDTVFRLAGGRVTAPSFTLAPEAKAHSVTLALSQIDLEKLSGLFGASDFSAQGTLNGSLPVVFSETGLQFKAGNLTSDGSGQFKYTPKQFPPSLQGDDPRLQTVREALGHFNFTQLRLDMNGPMDGTMTSSLHAEGTSPVFGDRPIKLNLNLEGDLGRVLNQTLQAGDIGATLRSIKKDKK